MVQLNLGELCKGDGWALRCQMALLSGNSVVSVEMWESISRQ